MNRATSSWRNGALALEAISWRRGFSSIFRSTRRQYRIHWRYRPVGASGSWTRIGLGVIPAVYVREPPLPYVVSAESSLVSTIRRSCE